MRGMRVALYYAPDQRDPLWRAGCRWLGRDAETGASVPQPDYPDLPAHTAAPRRYGFHATLKAPMRLATGWDELVAGAHAVARRFAPFALPPLTVGQHAGGLALVAAAPCPTLEQLAAELVTTLDRHRLQLDAADLARRRQAALDRNEAANLSRWGYPYVLDRFRFHMTLTGPDNPAHLHDAARDHFAAALAQQRDVVDLCLFTERAGPGETAPLLLAERLPLGGG